MLFNSFTFLIFFAVVLLLYYITPHKGRWVLLLVASYIFYMAWRPAFLVLILLSTLVNYFFALKIHGEDRAARRKRLLILVLIANFGLLFVFKYSVFINESFMSVYQEIAQFFYGLGGNSPEAARAMAETLLGNYPLKNYSILLPMGISFYTFQAVAYVVDVYRGTVAPQRHYGIFSLYLAFFPQLVAGPIERCKSLMPQFFRKHKFCKEQILLGLKIMLWGFFKKIVIADRLAIIVDTVYSNPQGYSGLTLVLATLLFGFQIYCDFSGYSDIALGCAKTMGFDLMQNFRNPYLSKSIKEFWRRWHISLSTWFMDYVYIPLGGNRVAKSRYYGNLMITFLLSGLWHGANWTFLIWGGLHGIYMVAGAATTKLRSNVKGKLHLERNFLMSFLGVLITFTVVTFAWIFFRAESLGDSLYVVRHLFVDCSFWLTPQYLYEMVTSLGVTLYELVLACAALGVLFLTELLSGKNNVYDFWEKRCWFLRLAFYTFIAVFILTAGVYYDAGQFIYFQF